MMIDLPVVILLDCQEADMRNLSRAAQKIIGTIRYDTEDHQVEALFFPSYPPPDGTDTKYWENADGILAHISTAANTRIKNAAARNPYDYMVGTEEERTSAQKAADREAGDEA